MNNRVKFTITKEFSLQDVERLTIAGKYCLKSRDVVTRDTGRWLEFVANELSSSLTHAIRELQTGGIEPTGDVD